MTTNRVFMSSAIYREMLIFSMLEQMPLADAERIADEWVVKWEQESEARAEADTAEFLRVMDEVLMDMGKNES